MLNDLEKYHTGVEMLSEEINQPHPWWKYSDKLRKHILSCTYAGLYSHEEALERGMRLVIGEAGHVADGNMIKLYWLLDESDGVIADVRFQVYGESALIGAADGACELLMRKNYDQAKRMSSEIIDIHLRDKNDQVAFPFETGAHLNLVLEAIEDAANQCQDIPLADTYVASPVATDHGETSVYPGWKKLNKTKKLAVIREVLEREIQPYIELDEGGVEVLDIKNGKEVIIAYSGSCTSCYSAIGGTLEAINSILQAKVHPEISVVPDMSNLELPEW